MPLIIPVLLIVLSRCFNQSEGVLIKKYNQKHGKGNFIFASIISLSAMLFFLVKDVIIDPIGFYFPIEMLPYAIGAGVSYALAYFTTCLAFKYGSFVLTALIISYTILVTIIHGLIVGESISILGWIGIFFILCSLYLVKGNKNGDTIKINKKWVICVVITFITNGLFGILLRQQQLDFQLTTGTKGIYDNEFMVLSLALSAIILFIIGIVKEKSEAKYIFKHGTLYAMGAGFANGICNLINLYVYTLVPMTFFAPVSSGTGILVAFIISKFLYKEKFSKLQYLGVLLGAIALVMFNL